MRAEKRLAVAEELVAKGKKDLRALEDRMREQVYDLEQQRDAAEDSLRDLKMAAATRNSSSGIRRTWPPSGPTLRKTRRPSQGCSWKWTR